MKIALSRTKPSLRVLLGLAVVLGAVLGAATAPVRQPQTRVAGEVVERDVVAPLPGRPAVPTPRALNSSESGAPGEQENDPVAAEQTPEPAAGHEHDAAVSGDAAPDEDADPNVEAPPERDREPHAQPERQDPQPQPIAPQEQPTEPVDLSQFALIEGEGLSRDTAEPFQDAHAWSWQMRSLSGEPSQDAASQGSRSALSRITVGFDQPTISATTPTRRFGCEAIVTAGSRRLMSDADHVFELSLWSTDGYSALESVEGALFHDVIDLGPGEHTTLSFQGTTEFDADGGVSYTCRVHYRQK